MFLNWAVPLALWFFLIASLHAMNVNHASSSGQQTFMDRCKNYESTHFSSVESRCDSLWTGFSNDLNKVSSCSTSESFYQYQYGTFLRAAMPSLPKDKVMFWSGTKGFAHAYARENGFVTLEDTPPGYIFDGLSWSSFSATCPDQIQAIYWASASSTYARYAGGKVTVVLNGSRKKPAAYNENSNFGKYELPQLTLSRVTSVDVLLAHYDDNKIETCKKGSLVDLEKIVEGKGIAYSCKEISGSSRGAATVFMVIFSLVFQNLFSNNL